MESASMFHHHCMLLLSLNCVCVEESERQTERQIDKQTEYECYSTSVQARVQLFGSSPLLPPLHGFQEQNSSLQSHAASTFTYTDMSLVPMLHLHLTKDMHCNWTLITVKNSALSYSFSVTDSLRYGQQRSCLAIIYEKYLARITVLYFCMCEYF